MSAIYQCSHLLNNRKSKRIRNWKTEREREGERGRGRKRGRKRGRERERAEGKNRIKGFCFPSE